VSQIRNIILDHVRACQEQGNQARREELEKLKPRLSISQIGHCPRQAVFEAARYHPKHPLHADPFDDYVQEVMEAGNQWEKQTGKALAYAVDLVVELGVDDPRKGKPPQPADYTALVVGSRSSAIPIGTLFHNPKLAASSPPP